MAAGRIPSDFVDQLIANSDIVEVIGKFVPLQKKGQEYMACCPFHEEKTPSFSVIPRKQFYYCFGCGAGGSVVKFLMEYRKMDFVEAIETLAQFAGVEVPRESGAPRDDGRHKQLLAALAGAFEFYRKNLAGIPTAAEYLERRGIDRDTADTFGLGYAPPGFDNLRRHFADGYDERLLLDAGLLSRKEDDRSAYDKFRGRLMFPIRDRRGRVIAFGGRVLKDEDRPKYLNSPETSVFHKRNTLYGAYETRKSGGFDRLIVVEGYMDVVSLHARGIRNAVATLGTAVTHEHVRQLFRLCKQLVFCFDGDLAGRKAAASALEQSLALFYGGYSVSFMFLPEGEDPDSFVAAHGKEAVEKILGEATPLSVFLFDHLRAELDLALPEGRASFTERARPMLAEVPRGAFRELLAEELADKAGVKAGQLLAAPERARPPMTRPAATHKTRFSGVRITIALLLLDPSLARRVKAYDDIRELNRPGVALLVDMLNRARQNPEITTAALLEQYRGGEHEEALIQLVRWPAPPDTAAEFEHAMEHLRGLAREQAFEQLVEKSKTRPLNEKEQEQLQDYLKSRVPAGQSPG